MELTKQMSNDAEGIMRAMSDVFKSVKAADGAPWESRVVLGCWAVCLLWPCPPRDPDR